MAERRHKTVVTTHSRLAIWHRWVAVCLLSLWSWVSLANSDNAANHLINDLPEFSKMQQAGLLLVDDRGLPVLAKRANQLLVPASTTKLVTAYLALQHWGEHYRFSTPFYLQTQQGKTRLWIKGRGDPFLTSEELLVLAKNLSHRLQEAGVEHVDELVLDTTLFEEGLILPGTGQSDNPYDAVPSALATNFNTLFLTRQQGRLQSAEVQTPLTPLSHVLGKSIQKRQRINTGTNPKVGQRYFAELLRAFLEQEGVSISKQVTWSVVDKSWKPFYVHKTQKTLAEIVRPMMKYSTNFIANQLVLMLAAESFGAPATQEKVKRLFKERLQAEFKWQGSVLQEGAGLSRFNRLSSKQLVDVLQRFLPWKHLLPEVVDGVYAKSGSLIGVSTLAGYLYKNERWWPFVVMMNEKAPYRYRNKVAAQLYRHLTP